MNAVIIGNFISLFAAAVMVGVGFLKKKEHILIAQCVQFSLYAAANLTLGGITGGVANFISILRNLICLKWKFTLPLKIGFIILEVALALAVNSAGWLGWLPIIAAVLFTWFLDLKDAIKFKYVIIVGQVLWVVYDFCMLNYVSCAFDALTIVTNVIGIVSILRDAKAKA